MGVKNEIVESYMKPDVNYTNTFSKSFMFEGLMSCSYSEWVSFWPQTLSMYIFVGFTVILNIQDYKIYSKFPIIRERIIRKFKFQFFKYVKKIKKLYQHSGKNLKLDPGFEHIIDEETAE